MITLFMRTYYKDIPWLAHSVKSMQKNLDGISEKILAIPDDTPPIPISIIDFFDKIVTIKEQYTGYIQQQIDKVRAYKYTNNEYILFSDSDCIYYNPVNANQYLSDGLVNLYYTDYSKLEGNVLKWKTITHNSTGLNPEREYMRCFPIMHHRHTCQILDTLPEWNNYLPIIPAHALSEFNALGVIADKRTNLYNLIDTHSSIPLMPCAKQYWSWGGITSDISKELETI
jgi:hypothetical protein